MVSYLGKAVTRDRLLSWGLAVSSLCVLCADGMESHSHLVLCCCLATGSC